MKDITIHPDATIKEAMAILDKTAEKVLLVVDENRTLLGSLTDGDIRRHILRGNDIGGTIQGAFNLHPIFIFQKEYDHREIKKIFLRKKIDLIPIVNQDRKVVDFVSWGKVFKNGKRRGNHDLNAPVVIMAGGRGTRLEPFTKVLPKPLILVGEKPVIDHIIERFRDHGVRQFYLTVHHMSKIMKAYFEEKAPDYSVEFAEEPEPRGTAGSLTLVSEKLKTPFFLSNCDIIIDADYHEIFRFHENGKYDLTLVASAKQFNISYGICQLNGNGSLERIQEKPKYDFLVNTGLYVVNPDVIGLIPALGMFHMTDLIEKIRENGGSIGVYPVSEKAWVDVGQWDEYRNALRVMEAGS